VDGLVGGGCAEHAEVGGWVDVDVDDDYFAGGGGVWLSFGLMVVVVIVGEAC
jgi:hypothetical protein